MYYVKTSKIVSAILAALGLVITLAQLNFKVGATKTSLPFHLQRRVEPDLQVLLTKANAKIAFTSDRNGFLDVYVMNADGSNQRQLTFGTVNPADVFSRMYTSGPVWSPDGSKIAFRSDLDYHGFNLYLMNADGSRIKKITNSGIVGSATWSPDGKRLAFSTTCFNFEGNPCETDIYTVNVDGSNLTKLIGSSDAAAYSPAWSPDGTKIAFVRESYGAPFPSIYVMNVDGNGETRLTFTSASALDANPKWSPAGSKIAF